MSDQKAVYSIEIQAAGEFPSNDNLMLSLSGNKNGSPCDSPLTRLVEPSQENQNSRKYELETVLLDEILSCTVLKDGQEALNLKCITGKISFVNMPHNKLLYDPVGDRTLRPGRPLIGLLLFLVL